MIVVLSYEPELAWDVCIQKLLDACWSELLVLSY